MASEDEKFRRKQLKDAYLRAEQASSATLMPIGRSHFEALLDHVEAAVEANGCDHTRKATDAWASANGLDLLSLHVALEEYGGYCDCEVVMNVHPDEVFEPVRRQ